MRRKLIIAVAAVAGLLLAAYLAVGYVLYNRLTDVVGACDGLVANTPANFGDIAQQWPATFDYAQYWMADYAAVRFPSRQEGIEIAGWWVESEAGGPTVIVVHGFGSCKHGHTVLTPAGMLARAGFNVLLIDLRDVGESTFEDGRAAIGNEEYLDVLGAWDWLVADQGIDPQRIGLLGNSMGAGTTLIAFDQEPRVAALFVDSPYSNLRQIITEELQRNDYPTWLLPSGVLMARLVAGDNLLAFDPENAMRSAGDRPVFVVHGTGDTRIRYQHSEQLAALAAANGTNLTLWLPEGVEHVRTAAVLTDEYESRLIAFFDGALR